MQTTVEPAATQAQEFGGLAHVAFKAFQRLLNQEALHFFQAHFVLLKLTVQQALDAGVFREGIDNVALISQTLWAGVHGVISLRIAKENDCWVDCQLLASAVDLMLDALMRGLTKEG